MEQASCFPGIYFFLCEILLLVLCRSTVLFDGLPKKKPKTNEKTVSIKKPQHLVYFDNQQFGMRSKLFKYKTMQEPIYISLRKKAQYSLYKLKQVHSAFHCFILFISCLQDNRDTSIIYFSLQFLNFVCTQWVGVPVPYVSKVFPSVAPSILSGITNFHSQELSKPNRIHAVHVELESAVLIPCWEPASRETLTSKCRS